MLTEAGIKAFFQIGLLIDAKVNDHVLSYESIVKATGINEKILNSYKVKQDQIPPQFFCSILNIVMDDPVYIKGGQDRYDFNSLRQWYTEKDRLWDPVRNIYIDYSAIIHDGVLKAEISQFVGKTIEQTLQQQVQKTENTVSDRQKQTALLQEIIKKYDLSLINDDNKKIALRRASAKGDVEDLNFLISLNVDINAKDSNPKNGKTALHWAVINKHKECITSLLQHKAKSDIVDAKLQTAKDYALQSDDPNIIDLFDAKQLEPTAENTTSLKMSL